ncbi:hypothetical protein RAA17_04265 [Komagataeibacter rhaeticus]|nr:hypothetical protein [Komagataeibacter rhaeticus]
MADQHAEAMRRGDLDIPAPLARRLAAMRARTRSIPPDRGAGRDGSGHVRIEASLDNGETVPVSARA